MIGSEACYTLTCDGDEGCDPWEEGQIHFRSAEAAVEWAQGNEWIVTGDRMVCRACAARADCAATTHRWGEWHDGCLEETIRYRRRYCGHCDVTGLDPPFGELSLLAHAARELRRGEGV